RGSPGTTPPNRGAAAPAEPPACPPAAPASGPQTASLPDGPACRRPSCLPSHLDRVSTHNFGGNRPGLEGKLHAFLLRPRGKFLSGARPAAHNRFAVRPVVDVAARWRARHSASCTPTAKHR